MTASGTVTEGIVDDNPTVGADRVRSDDRRRFTVASLWSIGLSAIPFLWVLWNGRFWPLRAALEGEGRSAGLAPQALPRAGSDFYEIQARALFDGTWAVPKGSLGIEAFVVDGREFLYFGPFASILRMPVMAVTDALDGRMTAPSMLLAWIVTAVFLPLLVWRARMLLRGSERVSRGEAVSVGAFIVAVLGGSVIVYLGALPFIYHEDFAWSIALVVAALFTLLGVLERPTGRGVLVTGALVLFAVLNRSATGWACVIAVLLAAVWFRAGRGGDHARRWFVPLLAAALIPLAINCYVTWAKFGTPFGLPMASQVWTKIDEHRRAFLDANDGRYVNIRFLPSTLLAYLRPDGLRLSSLFPFITLPGDPAGAVGGVVLDQTYRTGSLPLTTPLPFLAACWGLVTAFRPRPIGRAALLRIPLLGAAAATVGVLVWGYIAHRYLADFMPIVIVAGALGLVDVWRRLDGRSRRARRAVVAVTVALAAFGVVTNVAISLPTERLAWGGSETRDYIELQRSVGELIGRPITENVRFGDELPAHGPADQLLVLGDCEGLYVSTGERDRPWVAVERRPVDLLVTINEPPEDLGRVPLLTVGDSEPRSVVLIEGGRPGQVRFRVAEPFLPTVGDWQEAEEGKTYRVRITADTGRHEAAVEFDGREALYGWVTPPGNEREVNETRAGSESGVTVEQVAVEGAPLCRELVREIRGTR